MPPRYANVDTALPLSRGIRVTLLAAVGLAIIVASANRRQTPEIRGADAESTVAGAASPAAAHVSAGPGDTHPEAVDAELEAALVELCGSAQADGPAGETSPRDTEVPEASFRELQREVASRLAGSASADHLHAAALLEASPRRRLELIDRALSIDPDNAFLLWSAVQICAEARPETGCRRPDWEERLTDLDRQNSESWIRLAANRYLAGDTEGGLAALRQASTAAETRIYWPDTVELLERGLAAATDDAFPDRAALALGLSAALALPGVSDYLAMCTAQAAVESEWARACVAYGDRAEGQARVAITYATGMSLQRIGLMALGESARADSVTERAEARADERSRAAPPEAAALAGDLSVSDPARFAAYMEAARAQGEMSAFESLAARVARVMEARPDLVCVR